jgi:hypothetical protein
MDLAMRAVRLAACRVDVPNVLDASAADLRGRALKTETMAN